MATRHPNPDIPFTAQVDHPLPFDLRAVEDQDASVWDIGSIWDEKRLRLEVGGMSLGNIPDVDFREPAR